MKYNQLCGIAFSLIAGSVTANTGVTEDFRSAVSNNLISNTFQGSWKSGCLATANSATGYQQLSYQIDSEAKAELTERQFSDATCSATSGSTLFVGQLALESVKINSYGQYAYEFSVNDEESGTQQIVVSPERGDLIVFGANLPAYGVVFSHSTNEEK